MLPRIARSLRLLVSLSCLSIVSTGGALGAQSLALGGGSRAIANRLVQPIDENARVKLGGTVHPLATKANDRGAVSDGLKLDRLQIVLKRSDAQESDLKQLIGDMHQPGDASYHKWLTPDDFGKRFGPSEADVAKVESWLSSHGFSVIKLNPGRQTLEIAGSAGQFRDTFHSSIHSYQVKGQTHFANSGEPEIPTALAPVFAGFVSLNNFALRSHSHVLGKASYDPVTHESKPEWTKGDSSGVSLLLSPADYAVQYDLPAHTPGFSDGTGTSIAIINESNINISLVDRFRALFGLPANSPQVIIDGNDPGIDGINNPNGLNGASGEAYLDVEWSGALAPGAKINLVIGGDSAVGSGLLYAAQRAVYSNISPVISMSFGNCEFHQGANNAFFNGLWEQAAAQGITVLVSTGDNGSAACDNDRTQVYAVNGQAVSGVASTPYNIAVGGTDFYYANYAVGGSALSNEIRSYWNTTPSNASPVVSLLHRVPEQPWNNGQYGYNLDDYYASTGKTTIAAASGGASNCALGTADSNGNYTVCTGGYQKPSWQQGAGVPADGVRDLPDVSLFASNGANSSYYAFCASDGDCQPDSTEVQISGVGGTSASTPAFAGIMALVNQQYGRQGQANYVLYPLATQFPAAFHDVTVGSISVPCNIATVSDGTNSFPPNDCIPVNSPITASDDTYKQSAEGQIGVAGAPAYNAGAGYDLATGLGTIDATVLLANWNKVTFGVSTVTLTPSSTTIAHGTAVTFSGTVTGTITPTGDVELMTDSTVVGNQGEATFALTNGAFNGSVSYLPGGTYNVWGNYGGDGSNAASSNIANKTQITVTPENSTTALAIYTPSSTSYYGSKLASGDSVVYGTPLYTSAVPSGAANTTTAPTGSVVFSDGGTAVNTAVLSTGGEAEYFGFYPVGSHLVKAAYSGDASYSASTSSTFNFVVSKATPSFNASSSNTRNDGSLIGGQQTAITVTLENPASFVGNPTAPTGTVTLSGAPAGSATSATLAPAINPSTGGTEGVATFIVPTTAANTYTVTFNYPGDSNYSPASVQYTLPFLAAGAGLTSTTTAAVTGTNTANPGAKVLLTATVTGKSGRPAPTGTVDILGSNNISYGTFTLQAGSGDSTTITISFDSNGLIQGTNEITVQYSGDATYLPSNGTATLNNPLNDFKMVPQTTFVSVPSSNAAMDTVNLTSTNSFAGAVNLSCAGSGGITCSLSPATANLTAGGMAATTVNINTSAVTAVGTYNAVITGTDSTGNFKHTVGLQVVVPQVSGVVTPGYTLTAGSAITIATQGGSGTSTFTVTPTNGFTGDIALTCALTSSPTGASQSQLPKCSLSPATATIAAGSTAAVSSTLTVNTTAPSTADLQLPMKTFFATGGAIGLAAMLFFGLPVGRNGKGRLKALRTLRILSLAAAFALLAGAGIGCGGGKSAPAPTPVGGTTTGAYVFTVTATSGATTHTATVAVTVN